MINRENYESFFLDYIEGNLKEEQINQFIDFLNQNPDLKSELELFSEIKIEDDIFVFPEKNKLYKKSAFTESILNNSSIAYFENDLDENERKLFEEELINSSDLLLEQALFAKTKLLPDTNIRFDAKAKLKRKPKTLILATWTTRVAAIIVVLFAINSLINNKQFEKLSISNHELAETHKGNLESKPAEKVKNLTVEEKKEVKLKPDNIISKTSEAQELISESTNNPVAEPNESISLPKLVPIYAELKPENLQINLAEKKLANFETINESNPIVSLDEFLTSRVKKAGQDGLNAAQRIARLGLDVASEITGERIAYSTEQGKIVSIDFEHKLLAFSIPIKKNQ